MEEETKRKPYKSIEERIFVDSGIRDFLAYGGRALYGTTASMFRIPTLMRKVLNRQLWIQRKDFEEKEGVKVTTGATVGAAVGTAFGCCAGVLLYSIYSLVQTSKGNYVPLAILTATNILSGAYELGRLSKRKQENLELKAQQEAQKLQAQAEAQAEKAKN